MSLARQPARELPPEVLSFTRAEPDTLSSWFEECRMECEEWLIERLVPARSYTGIFGRRGSAKSFLALELVAAGATGRMFLGEYVERFGSLYCCGEKKSRFGKRIEAWRIANGGERLPLPVKVRWGVPDLLDAAEVDAFIAEIAQAKPEFEKRGAPLRVVVFDTFARCLRHANVSDPTAVGSAIEAIQRIIDETGVTVIPLAHVAKAEGSTSVKGAGELEDAADALIRIDRKEGEALRTVTLTKQSDEADGLAYGFELEVVEVGQTPRGRRVTSCVIRQVDLPDAEAGARSQRLNAPAQTVLSALARLLDEGHGRQVPMCPGVKTGDMGVRVEMLRAKAYDLGLQKASEPPADAPQTEKAKWVEARKKAFQRAVEKLQEARKVRVEGDYIWPL